KVARMPVRRLEPRSAFAEVDLARDAGVDHPLQRPVDGGAADAAILAPHAIEEVVRAEMAFLPQEHAENAIALGRALAAGPPQGGEVGELTFHRIGKWVPWQLGNLPSYQFTNLPISAVLSRPRRTGRTRRSTSRAGS